MLFCSCIFFSPFCISSLGEERANLNAFVRLSDFHLFGLSVLSSSLCLGRAAVCDYGTPWTFSLIFFVSCVLFALSLGVMVYFLFLLVSLVGYVL